MTNIFSKFKNMNDQLSNVPSIMFLRCLVMFLHFDTYAFENAQKVMLCTIPVSASGVFSQNVDFIRTIDRAVDRVNANLGVIERVRRFALTANAFTVDNEQMTPTLKVRRHVITEVYTEKLEGLYH